MTRQRMLSWLAVLVGATIPLGEGVALVALGLLTVGLAYQGWVERHRRSDTVPWWRCLSGGSDILLAFLGFFALGILAWGLGGEGALKLSELGRWLPFLGIPLALWARRHLSPEAFRKAAFAFVVALLLASLFGLVQYAFDFRPGESIWRHPSSVAIQSRVPGDNSRSVAGGFYFHRLKMAHVVLLGVGLLALRQCMLTLTIRRRVLEGAALALMTVALVLTFTRGALLATGAGIIVAVPFFRPPVRRLAVIALSLMVVAILASPAARSRLSALGQGSASPERVLIWSCALNLIRDYPYGVGIGNYPQVAARYYDAVDPGFSVRTYPHNIVLAAWAETGPLGLLAYLAFWGLFAGACVRVLRERSVGERGAVAAAYGLFITTAFLVLGMSHDVLFHKEVALAFLCSIGWCLAWIPADVRYPGISAHEEKDVRARPIDVASA